MESVGTGLGNSVDGAAVATVLRAIGAGESLKFGDGLNAQRCASDVAAGVALPPIQNIFAIQRVGISFGPRAGDGISIGHGSQRAASSLRVGGDTGRKQNELLEIAPIERQFS